MDLPEGIPGEEVVVVGTMGAGRDTGSLNEQNAVNSRATPSSTASQTFVVAAAAAPPDLSSEGSGAWAQKAVRRQRGRIPES